MNTRENGKRSVWNAVKSAEVVVSLIVGIIAVGGTLYGLVATSRNAPGPSPTTTSASPAPEPTGSGRTKAQYIEEIDALCLTASKDNDAVHERYGATIDGVQHTTSLLEHLARDWARVEQPRGDEQTIEDTIDELRSANAAAERAIFAYRNSDNSSYQRYVQEQSGHNDQHAQQAHDYGFTVCGQY